MFPKVKFTLTKKIIFYYFGFLTVSLLLTAVFSYFIFQKLIDNQMSVFEEKTSVFKKQIENLYQAKTNIFDLNEIKEKMDVNESEIIFGTVEKVFHGYNIRIPVIEGVIEFKETPKLIYDGRQEKYFLEITREVKFAENMPFKSIHLSIKFNYYLIILRSLVFASVLTAIFMFPIIIFFSKSIVTPILQMSNIAKNIASGNLGVQIDHISDDEVGALSESLNFMSNELFKMKRIRDELLATISHELRSPLGRIKGYTEIIMDLDLSKQEVLNYYQNILSEVDFLNEMAGEIIEISRLEMGKETLYNEAVLSEELRNRLLLVAKTFESAYNIVLDVDEVENAELYIDVEKIERVFTNLISNSIKASANKITISSRLLEKFIEFKITDNGVGIPEDQFELVFEKFYRVDKSRDRNTGGFGLGLSICKGIINEHGSNIRFEKPISGSGAIVIFSLPLYKDANPQINSTVVS